MADLALSSQIHTSVSACRVVTDSYTNLKDTAHCTSSITQGILPMILTINATSQQNMKSSPMVLGVYRVMLLATCYHFCQFLCRFYCFHHCFHLSCLKVQLKTEAHHRNQLLNRDYQQRVRCKKALASLARITCFYLLQQKSYTIPVHMFDT